MVKRAFSLIELLIVIALIAILTAIATASYSTMQKKARDSRRIEDVKSIQNAYEQYFSDNNSTYPAGDGCVIGENYLPNGYPLDPKSGSPYFLDDTTTCPGGFSYCFCAELEIESGNSANSCDGITSGNFYCVHERQ